MEVSLHIIFKHIYVQSAQAYTLPAREAFLFAIEILAYMEDEFRLRNFKLIRAGSLECEGNSL